MAKHQSWYGVRTLYRISAIGPRRGTDHLFTASMSLVEERVVVFRARDGKEAIRKAKAEARAYAASAHRNPYGQRVRTRAIGVLDAYDINEKLREGTEVFSQTEVVSRKVSDATIVRRLIGQSETKREFSSRRNVMDIVFNSPAPGVKLTAREQQFREKFTSGITKMRRDA